MNNLHAKINEIKVEEISFASHRRRVREHLEDLINEYAADLNLQFLAPVAIELYKAFPIEISIKRRAVLALAYLFRAASLLGLGKRIQDKILNYVPEPYVTRRQIWRAASKIKVSPDAFDAWKWYTEVVRQRYGDRAAEIFAKIVEELRRRNLLSGFSRAVTASQILMEMARKGLILDFVKWIPEMFGTTWSSTVKRRHYVRAPLVERAIKEICLKMKDKS